MIVSTPQQVDNANALFLELSKAVHTAPINIAVAAAMMVIADAFEQQPGEDYRLDILAFTIAAAKDLAAQFSLPTDKLDSKTEITLAQFEANRHATLN